jgi:hypothetical protein
MDFDALPEVARYLLLCAECGAESPRDAQGWRGYLTDDDKAVMFCPDCAKREFDAVLE